MIRRWLALTYYLYALRLAALSHFYFNRLYLQGGDLLPTCFQAACDRRWNAWAASIHPTETGIARISFYETFAKPQI